MPKTPLQDYTFMVLIFYISALQQSTEVTFICKLILFFRTKMIIVGKIQITTWRAMAQTWSKHCNRLILNTIQLGNASMLTYAYLTKDMHSLCSHLSLLIYLRTKSAPLSKVLYNLCHLYLSFTHSHIHTFTHSHTNGDWLSCKVPTSSSGAIGG